MSITTINKLNKDEQKIKKFKIFKMKYKQIIKIVMKKMLDILLIHVF